MERNKRERILRPGKREPKFYLTVYRVEVLSEAPIPSSAELQDVMVEALTLQHSMQITQTEQETVDKATIDKLLVRHGNAGLFDVPQNGVSDGE